MNRTQQPIRGARARSLHRAGRLQTGFSLIELLISMLLSSLVILAVVGVYTGSRENYTTQDEVGRLQENMRIGSGIIERTFRQGNYKRFPAPRDQNPMLIAAFSFVPLAGADGTGTSPGNSDMIEVRFNGSTDFATATPDGVVVDCMGAPVASTVQANNRFMVRVDAGGRPWLNCSTDGGISWTPLIPDVEAMEVLYGLYTSENRSVSSFVTWNAVTDPTRVVAVKIHMLYRSNAEAGMAPSTQTYPLAERTYGPFSDRFLRNATESTIVLRSVAL
ncbi:MAG: PilW family protein [Lautropia sp.]|nr:PilW family protein [Lautropia sp.]